MAKTMFEPGDVVQLKSGGAKMTVKSVNGDDVDCRWHDKQDKVVEYVFPKAMLELVHKPAIAKPIDWPNDPGQLLVPFRLSVPFPGE